MLKSFIIRFSQVPVSANFSFSNMVRLESYLSTEFLMLKSGDGSLPMKVVMQMISSDCRVVVRGLEHRLGIYTGNEAGVAVEGRGGDLF
jgi:hypothetical protein